MFKRNRAFLALMLMVAFLLATVALAVDYKYAAPRRGKRYHYPTCEYVQGIEYRHLMTFNSAKEAQDAGYAPCPICKPPATD